jgi:hypothetical protein
MTRGWKQGREELKMVPEKQISEFVSRMRERAGTNLQSVILYGSASAGEFHSDFSNVNLLCVLRASSFTALRGLVPVVRWWTKQKHHAPLVLTHEEIVRSADVFSIEMLDMKRRHRVLFGDDILKDLQISMQFHRAQVEYELREKQILLRQHLLAVGEDEKQMWALLQGSLSSFSTLFRHALILFGEDEYKAKRETIQALSFRIQFDSSAFFQLLDIREHKAETKQFDVKDVFTRYLDAVQQVTNEVDTMLD